LWGWDTFTKISKLSAVRDKGQKILRLRWSELGQGKGSGEKEEKEEKLRSYWRKERQSVTD